MKNQFEQFSSLPDEDHFKLEFALQFLEIKEAVKKGSILLDQITNKTKKQLGKLTYHGIRWAIAKEYLNLDEALDLPRTEARWFNLEFFSVRLAVDQSHITLGKALKLTQNQCDNLESFFVQQAIEQGYLTLDRALNLTQNQRCNLESFFVRWAIERGYLIFDKALELTSEQKYNLECPAIRQLIMMKIISFEKALNLSLWHRLELSDKKPLEQFEILKKSGVEAEFPSLTILCGFFVKRNRLQIDKLPEDVKTFLTKI